MSAGEGSARRSPEPRPAPTVSRGGPSERQRRGAEGNGRLGAGRGLPGGAASRRDPPPELEGWCLGLTLFDFQKKRSEVSVRSLLYVRGRLAP